MNFLKEEKKENIKNNTTLKAVVKTASLRSTYWKKENQRKKNVKKHKSSYNEDGNDYDDIGGTVESSEESENLDGDYEDDDGDG